MQKAFQQEEGGKGQGQRMGILYSPTYCPLSTLITMTLLQPQSYFTTLSLNSPSSSSISHHLSDSMASTTLYNNVCNPFTTLPATTLVDHLLSTCHNTNTSHLEHHFLVVSRRRLIPKNGPRK